MKQPLLHHYLQKEWEFAPFEPWYPCHPASLLSLVEKIEKKMKYPVELIQSKSLLQTTCFSLPVDCEYEIFKMFLQEGGSSSESMIPHLYQAFRFHILPWDQEPHYQERSPSLYFHLQHSYVLKCNGPYIIEKYVDMPLDDRYQFLSVLTFLLSAFGSLDDFQTFQHLFIQPTEAPMYLKFIYLYIAVKYGNDPIVTFILHHVASFGLVKQVAYENILGIAATFGHNAMVQSCIEFGHVNPTRDCYYTFEIASMNGNLELLHYLVSYWDIHHCSQNLVVNAASNGHVDVLKYLMTLDRVYGITPSAHNNEAIRFAASNGHVQAVAFLMELDAEYGIDPTARHNEAIRHAISNGHLEVVQYLMALDSNYNIDPAALDNYGLRKAVENSHMEMIDYLIEELGPRYGIDPTARTWHRRDSWKASWYCIPPTVHMQQRRIPLQ